METRTTISRLLVLAAVGSCLCFSPSRASAVAALSDDALKDCKRFAASDHLLTRLIETKNVSEYQKDEFRKSAFVNVSILFACNDPQTRDWQSTPGAKDLCADVPKLMPSEIELSPAPKELTEQPWRICTKDLLSKDVRARLDKAYDSTTEQIGKTIARSMQGEGSMVDHEPSQDDICKAVMSESARTPKRPATAAMAMIEHDYHLPTERLNLTPNESLETFRDLGFEQWKPTVKITDQADVPQAAIFILKKTGSCPVPAETGYAAVKCGANNLFWSPTEKNKDLNQFLKDNSECIASILVRPSWSGVKASPGSQANAKPAVQANQVK